MIELQVIAVKKEGLATEYRLSPDPVIIGAMDSHYEEKLHLTIPESWKGRAVRVTFTPDMCEGVGLIMDADGCVPITAAFSGAATRGVITVEAFEVDETDGETVTRKTFARDVRYRAIPHAAPGEPPEDITPTQFEQFIANVTAATQANAKTAAESAEDAYRSEGEAVQARAEAVAAMGTANAAAQDAEEYAKSAATSATDAAQSETEAQEAAEAAKAAQDVAEEVVNGFDAKVESAKEEIDEKVTSANETIDEKVAAASGHAGTASSGAAAAVNAQSLAQQAQSKAEEARDAAAESAQKAADSEFAATNAAGTLMSVADDTANAIVLEASGSVVQIAAANRHLKELIVGIDPCLEGRTGAAVTVSGDGAELVYTADFGETVYGGTYNWKTGELTKTWQAFVFDGTEGWALAGGETDSLLPTVFKGDPLNIARKNTAMCNRYERGTTDGTVGQFWIDERTSTDYNVRFMCDKAVAADIATWKTYLADQYAAGTPVVMVAEIVEPETAALASVELPRTIAPSCSVAASTGDVSLTYVADTKTYVDENSGGGDEIDLTDYVKNTDYASVGTYGLVKTTSNNDDGVLLNNGVMSVSPATTATIDSRKTKRPITPTNLDYAVKSGLANNNQEWADEEKQSARSVIGAVGATDYATENVGGVVRTNYRYGIVTGNDGVISIYPATTAHIDGKSVKNPIAPSNLDYAIKVGLTTNTETLTDAEKVAVQKWLGMTMATNEAKPWTVVQRSTNGVIYVGTPTANSHAATKAYVDGLIAELEARIAALETEVTT